MATKPGVRSLLLPAILWVCLVSAGPLSTSQNDFQLTTPSFNDAQNTDEAPRNGDGDSLDKAPGKPEVGAEDSDEPTTFVVSEATTSDPEKVDNKGDGFIDGSVGRKDEDLEELKTNSDVPSVTDPGTVYTAKPTGSSDEPWEGTSSVAPQGLTTEGSDLASVTPQGTTEGDDVASVTPQRLTTEGSDLASVTPQGPTTEGSDLASTDDVESPELPTDPVAERDDEGSDNDEVKPTSEAADDFETTNDDGESTTKASDIAQEEITSTPPNVMTSTQQDDTASVTPEVKGQEEPAVGRVVAKDESSGTETTKSDDDVDVDETDSVTESSVTLPSKPDTTVAAVVAATPTDSAAAAATDGDVDDDVREGGVDTDGISVEEKAPAADVEEEKSPEADPTLAVVTVDGADTEKELSVQTRDDGDDGGDSTVGVDNTGDDQTSQEDDGGDGDKAVDDEGSDGEGDIGKVVSLDDLAGGDAKDKGGAEEGDVEEDESSEDETDIKEDKILDLEEAEKIWGGENSEEGEEGSGSADEDLGSTDVGKVHGAGDHDGHSTTDDHNDHHNDTEHGHGDHHSHKDSAEDKENKKRTAIIVGVALGGAALLTLGIFTTRQCKQKAKFTPLQKVKEQNDPEAIEFRPVSQTGTALSSDTGTQSGRPPSVLDKKNGLYRHGPNMGPPSPRFTRKADDGKFRFPDSPTAGGKRSPSASPVITPLLGQSPAENGRRGTPNLSLDIKPAGGAANGAQPAEPAQSASPEPSPGQGGQPDPATEPLMNGVDKLKYIDESTDDEGSVQANNRPHPLSSHDPRLSNLVEESTPASPPVHSEIPPSDSSALEPANNLAPKSDEGV